MAFKFLDRVALLAVRGFTKEVRRFREVVQQGIDSYRLVNKLPPLFEDGDGHPMPPAMEVEFMHGGDFLTIWLIEELAREFNVRLTPDTNLEHLAIDRGWTDPQGKFLLLPASAATALDSKTIEELLSAAVPR